MIDITTWYRRIPNTGDYTYNHFTYGHSILQKPEGHKGKWLKQHCQLDTSKSPSKVID